MNIKISLGATVAGLLVVTSAYGETTETGLFFFEQTGAISNRVTGVSPAGAIQFGPRLQGSAPESFATLSR